VEKEKQSKKESFWEIIRFAIITIIIVIPIRIFIAQPFVVSGTSMFPTFDNGDYLIIDEISYRLNDPSRYDVAVFKFPNDPDKYFIKRIIGLPNETVEIKGNSVTIYNKENVNGFQIEQPYVKNKSDNNLRFELKENEYFVMGDNRVASSDSRYWGPVDRNLFAGRALLRLLPITQAGILPGNFSEIK
jgi:signal peptidase I